MIYPTSMIHMLKGIFLLQGLNNRLSALLCSEAKGLWTGHDRRLVQKMGQGKTRFVAWWSCKGHAVPAALEGVAHLQAYFNSSCWNKAFALHHRIPHGEPGQYSNLPLPSLRSFHWEDMQFVKKIILIAVTIFDY
jgi:hypothetical protein